MSSSFTVLVVLLAVLAAFWFLAAQARNNLSAKGIPVSYDWLDDPANIQLGEGIQTVDDPDGRRLTMSRALWVGMVNTLRIASIGIIASTVIGVVVGTYSSIYVSANLLVALGVAREVLFVPPEEGLAGQEEEEEQPPEWLNRM